MEDPRIISTQFNSPKMPYYNVLVNRKAELLPKFSAHVMRHTACTRMAECRMDVKVLQYIMGHAHIDVTMEVYNHIGELTRIENEIARLDSMVLNA